MQPNRCLPTRTRRQNHIQLRSEQGIQHRPAAIRERIRRQQPLRRDLSGILHPSRQILRQHRSRVDIFRQKRRAALMLDDGRVRRIQSVERVRQIQILDDRARVRQTFRRRRQRQFASGLDLAPHRATADPDPEAFDRDRNPITPDPERLRRKHEILDASSVPADGVERRRGHSHALSADPAPARLHAINAIE